MGVVKAGLGFMVLAAAGAAYLAPQQERPFEALEQARIAVSEEYELLRGGRDTGCVIRKGDRLSQNKIELLLGKGCGDDLADYAGARYWSEEPDGSVAFVMADGSVALRFAVGDGTAYEAFGDGVPLFALTDASY
jgi:hypothetical protein